MRIFLDANILFSAARADGAMRRLIDLAVAAGHELWGDVYVVAEARRNLLAKAPAGVTALEDLLAKMKVGALTLPQPDSFPQEADSLPDKDRPVLAAAIRRRCDVLVTGDRTHFGAFYGLRLAGVLVLSPAMLAQTLLAS